MINGNQKRIIESNPVSLATVTTDNKPNVVAVASVKVCDNKTIVITDNFMNRTVTDIQDNPNVCLISWDRDWNGIKIIGKARYYLNGKWLDFVRLLKENKNYPAKGAIVIKIEKVFELK